MERRGSGLNRCIPLTTSLATLFVAAFWVAGCTTQPETMVPEVTPVVAQGTRKSTMSLRVAPVTEATQTFWQRMNYSVPMGKELFRSALIIALTRTQLFDRVTAEGPADYVLETHVNEYRSPPGLPPTYLFFVSYRLKKLPANSEVWSDDIVTEGEVPAFRSDRDVAAQSNISKLIIELSKVPLS